MLFISSLKLSKSDFAVIVLPKMVIIAKWYFTNYRHFNCYDNKLLLVSLMVWPCKDSTEGRIIICGCMS